MIAKYLLTQLEGQGYLVEKPSESSKLGSTLSGWMLSDNGWNVYLTMK